MSHKTVLVIDDSATIRKLVDTHLSPVGYRVVLVPNAEEGLRLAMEIRPDLILLDHQLPGTTGYDVCCQLVASPELRQIPVVVSSTLRKKAYAEYVELDNVVDMLPKPYTEELLRRNRQFRKYSRCEERTNPTPLEISLGKCGWQNRPWSTGDNVNLSVGQGDLAANPLQMAVAYAAIANGGKVLRPRLGLRIENSAGQAEQNVKAPTARRLGIPAEYRQAILDGIRGAASAPGGTSTAVFESFPMPGIRPMIDCMPPILVICSSCALRSFMLN
jgi:CheY-like chemotaxis protein